MRVPAPAHAIGVFPLAIFLLVFLIIKLEPQIPVDVRPLPKTPMVGAPAKTYAPQYELIALHYVLNELTVNAQLLQNEAWNYSNDAAFLWSVWKNYFGIREGLMDWGWFLDKPQAPADRFLAERFQSELFRLDSRGKQLKRDTDELIGRTGQMEDRCAEIRDLALGREIQGSDAPSLEAPVAEFRLTLFQLAGRLNALDTDMRDRQEELDEIYPRFERYIYERLSGPPTLPRPWHWRYMLSDQPRPMLRYDFERRYFQVLDQARHGRDVSIPPP